MRLPLRKFVYAAAIFCSPAFGAVHIVTVSPSQKSPQVIGTSISWTVRARDTNAGPLTFQFNIAPAGGASSMIKDFNVGKHSGNTWAPPVPFVWTPTGSEGSYQIQVVAKDFATGETDTKTVSYQVSPLVTGSLPVVAPTSNSLIALFSAPACALNSTMRVSFQQQSGATPATFTNWASCDGVHSMTFEIAGMYQSTAYDMFSQTETGTNMVNGPTQTFTTSALPKLTFPTYTLLVSPGPQTDTTDSMLLHSVIAKPGEPMVATDLYGTPMWYYAVPGSISLLTRPLQNATMLFFQGGSAWNPKANQAQLLRQTDLAGNILHETNTGILQVKLQEMGAVDAQACNSFPSPPPVGSACLGEFSHDAIQSLPNGYTAVQLDIEKIFPVGTQGDVSKYPVDIVGDMIVVLDNNFQPVWYFDAFDHADGAPQLDINRAATLNEVCAPKGGCPFVYLLGPGVAPHALDWLHGNTIYYWPQSGDLLWSCRNQDWVMKIDYNYGAGGGDILWRMGRDGDFTFNNVFNDRWPWFSGQHEVGIENGGAGPLSAFDNGNSRVAPPPIGLGKRCGPYDCNSRGMILTVDETTMQVTPVLSVDLGVFSFALGSAQLLSDGNYFFQPGDVNVSGGGTLSYSIEVLPTPATHVGDQVLNLQGPQSYRSWQMPSLYAPPIT
jgi:arylsulfate sulfotransferase